MFTGEKYLLLKLDLVLKPSRPFNKCVSLLCVHAIHTNVNQMVIGMRNNNNALIEIDLTRTDKRCTLYNENLNEPNSSHDHQLTNVWELRL